MELSERAAYLKGLLEGLKLDPEKPETKLLTEIINMLEDMAMEIGDVEDEVIELNDYAEELDEDLGVAEEILFGDDFDCDGDCECCDGCDDWDWDDEDEEYIDCPDEPEDDEK